ncbi:MAG: hypothetical protein GY757_16535 [bacterium]|nr:hypothetical protein [bacterium]
MRHQQVKLFTMLLLWICLTGIQAENTKKFPVLKGDYLGQPLPGEKPVVFARGIVSTDSTMAHSAPTFSPDGNEVFWQSNRLTKENEWLIFGMSMRRVGGKWTAPEISPFDSGQIFSTDGKRLYYVPFGKEKGEQNGPYFVEKQGNSWNKPKCMGLIARFPQLKFVYNLSLTSNSTLYFLGYAEGQWNNFGIYRTEFSNGEYAKPELLPPGINAPGGMRNWTPFIAPDESYLLFCSTRGLPASDQGDLFVSFRQAHGSWTDPVSLGETINSAYGERFPAVSPDGKYLFFTRSVSQNGEDVFWVSAEIIKKLKKKVFQELSLKKKK